MEGAKKYGSIAAAPRGSNERTGALTSAKSANMLGLFELWAVVAMFALVVARVASLIWFAAVNL